ncbi:uncharacterized protein LOC141569725 [Rhinolophus sinicus]|uniref:uncharacterized protein LOC141569725 n=1 Tax=Rhinolophus sinicus TaxID=89399 RepID=UPI003D7918F9
MRIRGYQNFVWPYLFIIAAHPGSAEYHSVDVTYPQQNIYTSLKTPDEGGSPRTAASCPSSTVAEFGADGEVAEHIRNNSRALNGKQANTQSTTPTPKKPTRRQAITPSAAKDIAETHAKMQREHCSVPNMAESLSRCGHPGSEHWGARGRSGRRRTLTRLQEVAGLAERHKGEPNAIWQNPTFHPALQGRQIRQQNPSFEGPGRRRVFRAGAERQSQRRPRAVPRRGVCRAPPSAPGASAGGGPKPTLGPPPRRPAPPPRPSPAPPASARRRERERDPGTPHGWWPQLVRPRPRPALPAGPGLRAPSCPQEQAPPRAPGPARRAQRGAPPASSGRSARGRRGGPRPVGGLCGRYLAVAAAASRKPQGGRGCGKSRVRPRRQPPEEDAQRWEPPSPLSRSCCRRRRCRLRATFSLPVDLKIMELHLQPAAKTQYIKLRNSRTHGRQFREVLPTLPQPLCPSGTWMKKVLELILLCRIGISECFMSTNHKSC